MNIDAILMRYIKKKGCQTGYPSRFVFIPLNGMYRNIPANKIASNIMIKFCFLVVNDIVDDRIIKFEIKINTNPKHIKNNVRT